LIDGSRYAPSGKKRDETRLVHFATRAAGKTRRAVAPRVAIRHNNPAHVPRRSTWKGAFEAA